MAALDDGYFERLKKQVSLWINEKRTKPDRRNSSRSNDNGSAKAKRKKKK